MPKALLSVDSLVTEFVSGGTTVKAVNGVSFEVFPGETIGIVGESGSGKSVTVRSILGLLPSPPARIVSGTASFDGQDLLALSQRGLSKIRGRDIGMVFQDPGSSLNPVFTVGRQLVESVRIHGGATRRQAKERSLELLDMVGVPNPTSRFDEYPHQYSGGMKQRVMIAMAIANKPKLLIADEPTTALDVTIQAQVLAVLNKAKADTGAATILITHDLGLIAELADRVIVMYAGRVIETGSVSDIFHAPRHPYTVGLLASRPSIHADVERLVAIDGSPPTVLPDGCSFHPRCAMAAGREPCHREVPPLARVSDGHRSACHYHDEVPSFLADSLAARPITRDRNER